MCIITDSYNTAALLTSMLQRVKSVVTKLTCIRYSIYTKNPTFLMKPPKRFHVIHYIASLLSNFL